MPENQPETYAFRVNAEHLRPGQGLVLADGGTAPVESLSIETDDFGVPALAVALLEDNRTVRMAYGSTVRVQAPAPEGPPSAAVRSVPTEEEGFAAVLDAAAQAHPEVPAVREITARLGRGFNVKSGSQLQDVRDLAHLLYVDLADARHALQVSTLLTGLPFDGNFGRWHWIQGTLALASHITREQGDPEASAAFARAVRAADDSETDPLKAKLAAELLQRQLNQPNLYDREIHRAAEAGDQAAEREWRVLRLDTLLYLRAHGGSQTLSAGELERRIDAELAAVRALGRDGQPA